MMKFINWFKGFFEDQNGAASSKRGTLYILLFFLFLIVQGSLEGKVVDQQLLFMVCGLIAFLVGAVTSEYFNKIPLK